MASHHTSMASHLFNVLPDCRKLCDKITEQEGDLYRLFHSHNRFWLALSTRNPKHLLPAPFGPMPQSGAEQPPGAAGPADLPGTGRCGRAEDLRGRGVAGTGGGVIKRGERVQGRINQVGWSLVHPKT